MSRPKTVGGYPMYMLDILDRLEARPDIPIELKFPSRAAANSFRLDFYSFRTCAVAEGMEKTYPNLKAIEIRVGEEGAATILHKDRTPEGEIIERGLELAKKKEIEGGSSDAKGGDDESTE